MTKEQEIEYLKNLKRPSPAMIHVAGEALKFFSFHNVFQRGDDIADAWDAMIDTKIKELQRAE